MCQLCYNQGYKDYPEFLGSNIEHRVDYIAGYKEKQNKLLGKEELESTPFCRNCYDNGIKNEKIGIWSPPLASNSGHFESYEKGYYQNELIIKETQGAVAEFRSEIYGNGNGNGNGASKSSNYFVTYENPNKQVLEDFPSVPGVTTHHPYQEKKEDKIHDNISKHEINLPKIAINQSNVHTKDKKMIGSIFTDKKNRKILVITIVGAVGVVALGYYMVTKFKFKGKTLMSLVAQKKADTSSLEALQNNSKTKTVNLDTLSKIKSENQISNKPNKETKIKITNIPVSNDLNKTLITTENKKSKIVSKPPHPATGNHLSTHKSHKNKKHLKHKKHKKHKKHQHIVAKAITEDDKPVPSIVKKTATLPSKITKKETKVPSSENEDDKTQGALPVKTEKVAKNSKKDRLNADEKLIKNDEKKIKKDEAKISYEKRIIDSLKNAILIAQSKTKTVVQTPSSKNNHDDEEDKPTPKPGRYYTFRPVDENSPSAEREEEHTRENKTEKTIPSPIVAPSVSEPEIDTTSGKYPIASKKLLTNKDIAKMTKDDLNLMREEILARHHFIFKEAKLINYFSKQKWYSPLYMDVIKQLTIIEKQNLDFINKLVK